MLSQEQLAYPPFCFLHKNHFWALSKYLRGGAEGGPRGGWKYFLTDKHLVRRLQRPSGKQSLNCIANQLHQVLDVMLALCTAHAAAHLSARKAGGARGKSFLVLISGSFCLPAAISRGPAAICTSDWCLSGNLPIKNSKSVWKKVKHREGNHTPIEANYQW